MAFFCYFTQPCDGVGGLLKRMATKANLQRPYQDQIQTPHQLYEFTKQNVASLNFKYVNVRDWETEGKLLETRQLHFFRPVSLFKVKVSKFSTRTQTGQETVTAEEHVIRFEEVKGYITVQYDGWW